MTGWLSRGCDECCQLSASHSSTSVSADLGGDIPWATPKTLVN